MEFIPTKDYMVIREVKQVSGSIVVPENQKNYSDDSLFEIVRLPKDDESGYKVGDYVVIVGMLHHFRHAGERITVAKFHDIVMTVPGGSFLSLDKQMGGTSNADTHTDHSA